MFFKTTGRFDPNAPNGVLFINQMGQPVYGRLDVPVDPAPIASLPPILPVVPTIDPKIEAAALYGKPIVLSSLGLARIGAAGSAPISGPWINTVTRKVSLLAGLGFNANLSGTRVLYDIALDDELAWVCPAGGTLPEHGTFKGERFNFRFYQGRVDHDIDPLESTHFPGDGNAYNGQMVLAIDGLPYDRFLAKTGKYAPYVAPLIGDTTGGADPRNGTNLGTLVERIAFSPWGRKTPETFETRGITDICDGILLGQNITFDELCQVITFNYPNLVYFQSGRKMVLKDIGASVAPVITFTRERIVGGANAVEIVRAGSSGQPEEDELKTIDPDADFTVVPSIERQPRDPVVVSGAVGKRTSTLPLVINAATRQALVAYRQAKAENARKRIRFRAMPYGIKTEVGDVFGMQDIADGIDDEAYLAIEATRLKDKTTELVGEAVLRCTPFSDVGSDPYWPYVVLLLGCEGADGSTTFTDESARAHGSAAIIGNAQVDTAQFPFGTSSYLGDGSGDGLSFSDSNDWDLSDANGDAFTIELIAKLSTPSVTQRALVWQGGTVGTGSFAFWINASGQLELLGATAGTFDWSVTAAAQVASAAAFKHLAVTKDGAGKVRLFGGGVLAGSGTPASSVLFNSNQTLRIGCDGSGGRSWPGWLKEVRITKGVCRYPSDAGFTPPSTFFPRS